ncbi:histidine phosphatase family protein [Mycobacterium sp. C31M]
MKDASGTGPTRRYLSRTAKLLGITLISSAMLIGAAIPAAAELMRVTFVRHGQSAGNASGLIDTSTPGPLLTQTGQDQAKAVIGTLGVNNYDGVYASIMQRTQLTATPLSQYLHLPIQVLPGVHEIEAGVFEGTPESEAANGYGRFPLAWALQGNRDLRIPGSIDGHEFDARMDGSLQQIYDNGDRNAVVFSHGGAIMFWTMMNATNLTMEQKLDLLRYSPLGNTNYVVIEGSPEEGWKLVSWNGQKFGPDASLADEVRLQFRTLQRQLAGAVHQVVASFGTLNPAKVLAAIAASFSDTVVSIAKFAGAVNNKLATEWAKKNEPSPTVQAVPTAAGEPEVAARTAAVEEPATSTAEASARDSDSKPAVAETVLQTSGAEADIVEATEPEPVEATDPEEVQTPKISSPTKSPRSARTALSGATTAKKAGPRAKVGAGSPN